MIFASDLDRTLIHPKRTLPAGLRERARDAEIYEGRAITVCSPATLDLLGGLGPAFVPVTTRSEVQLRRVTPIWELARDGWAVCANGATLLHRGEPDPAWQDHVATQAARAASLAEARDALHRALGPADPGGWLRRVRDCDEHFLYAICEPDRMPAGAPREAQLAMDVLGWQAVLHGYKLYLLPAHLTKEACVAHVAERLGSRILVAAGDSLLDVGLLERADVALCPADAELVALGAVPAGAEVTAGRHLGAAEEIARRAVALLADAPTPA